MVHRRIAFLWSLLTPLALIAAGDPARAQEPSPGDCCDVPSIRVTGTGKASVKPDIAIINLGVEARASTAEEARARAAMAMTAVLEAARRARVEDKDMQTTWVGLNPVYAPDSGNRISGYEVSHQLTLKVHDISSAGTVLDGAVKAGGDAARLQGLSFGIEDTGTAESEAREKAYADARARAEQYARHSGMRLGKPLRISEAGGGVAPPIPMGAMTRMATAEAATPVQTGEQEVAVSVEVVFGIDQPAP
ncbi:MAG: SIMPL domain-containing protein [Chromatiales bacterium]